MKHIDEVHSIPEILLITQIQILLDKSQVIPKHQLVIKEWDLIEYLTFNVQNNAM